MSFLDNIMDLVAFLENYTDGKIDQIGLFEGFAVTKLKNAYIFFIHKKKEVKLVDVGWCYKFKEMPDFISKYGLNCDVYAVLKGDYIIGVSPLNKCKGEILIKIPPKQKLAILDPFQSSLHELLDKPTSRIYYKGRVIGVLSQLTISPIADIIIEEIRKKFKHGEFEAKDEKTVVAEWRQRIEFGARPVFFNADVSIDIDRFFKDMVLEHVSFDDAIEIIRESVKADFSMLSEYVIRGEIDGDYWYAKIASIKINIGEFRMHTLICKPIGGTARIINTGSDIDNVLLALLLRAENVVLGNNVVKSEKISHKLVKEPKKREFKEVYNLIKTLLGDLDIYATKLKYKKIKGEAIYVLSKDKAIIFFAK